MSDKEVEEINQRKLKEKGAQVVKEKEMQYDPEKTLFVILEYINKLGLDLMNTSNDLKTQIINYKQQKLTERNGQNKS